MDLDSFVITVFCMADDAMKEILQGRRLRQRGPNSIMADSEVVTMEVVGVYLGLGQDQAIYMCECAGPALSLASPLPPPIFTFLLNRGRGSSPLLISKLVT